MLRGELVDRLCTLLCVVDVKLVLNFPTRTVLLDIGRRDDTLPPPPFPKTFRQMSVLAVSSYFHFFRVFIKFFWKGAHAPLGPRPRMPISKQTGYKTVLDREMKISRIFSFEMNFWYLNR